MVGLAVVGDCVVGAFVVGVAVVGVAVVGDEVVWFDGHWYYAHCTTIICFKWYHSDCNFELFAMDDVNGWHNTINVPDTINKIWLVLLSDHCTWYLSNCILIVHR